MRHYRRKVIGMGRTPLIKVETTTAPIYTGNPLPTAPLLTTNSPEVTGQKWWETLTDYLPKVIDVAAPLIRGRNEPVYQTPTFNSQPQTFGNQQQNSNANYVDTGSSSSKKGLGDFITENPIVVGVGTIAIGLLTYKAFKK